jgi:hypothetical protein
MDEVHQMRQLFFISLVGLSYARTGSLLSLLLLQWSVIHAWRTYANFKLRCTNLTYAAHEAARLRTYLDSAATTVAKKKKP